MNIKLSDMHENDFHVYIDGGLRHRIPCGVCARAGREDHDMRAEMKSRYGVDLAEDMRETVRRHLEAYVRDTHPSSSVSGR